MLFRSGLLSTSDASNYEAGKTISSSAIRNIRLAQRHLGEADHFFEDLDEGSSIPILKYFLYYDVLEKGSGATLINGAEVCLDYEIFAPSGKSLNAEKKTILQLVDTIPGFAHGLHGMKRGEKRMIYIHPALAYGVHTYLEKGVYLKAIVQLHDFRDVKGILPPLKPQDLSFVQSEKFQERCLELHNEAVRFVGMKKGQFLQSCPGIDKAMIAEHLQAMSDDSYLSREESECLNQYFWDLYFATESVDTP